jgi:predicted esterase
MTDIKALEAAVTALPPEDLAEFRRWFTEFDSARWDREIEQDVAAGRLDAFLAEAQADYLSGDATRVL